MSENKWNWEQGNWPNFVFDYNALAPFEKRFQRESGTSWREMYQVFNCGHRMELYVPETIADSIIEISESFGIDAQRIGRVEKSREKKLTITSPYGTFTY